MRIWSNWASSDHSTTVPKLLVRLYLWELCHKSTGPQKDPNQVASLLIHTPKAKRKACSFLVHKCKRSSYTEIPWSSRMVFTWDSMLLKFKAKLRCIHGLFVFIERDSFTDLYKSDGSSPHLLSPHNQSFTHKSLKPTPHSIKITDSPFYVTCQLMYVFSLTDTHWSQIGNHPIIIMFKKVESTKSTVLVLKTALPE